MLFLVLSAASEGLGSFLLTHFLEIPLSYACFIGVNLTIFLAYGFDKYQAIRSQSRIPEIVPHLLALAGGSPAALLAQITFRHKTRKRSFRVIFVLIVVVQLIVIAGIILQNHGHRVSG